MGITDNGNIILVMIAQKPGAAAKSGMSLPALADFMKTLGIEKAMNLDGGSSSSLYVSIPIRDSDLHPDHITNKSNAKSFYGKVDEAGNPIKRPVKSVLQVQQKVMSLSPSKGFVKRHER